jgi:hypothetical protein
VEKPLSKQDELKAKIDTIHGALNELYSLDDSWRNLAKWPEGVSGSVLHDGASNDEIAQAELRVGHRFPPSYKEFLRLHSGWEHFWSDVTLIGTGRPETQRAQDEIAENIQYQISKLQNKFGDSFSPEAVRAWESEEARNLYLANHVVIGTDFSGYHWVYDTRTRGANDEMKLVYWSISFGAQEPMFDTFDAFLDWTIGEVAFHLKPLKRKKGGKTEQANTEKKTKRVSKKKSS